MADTELYLKTERLLHFRMAFAGVCLALSLLLGVYARAEFDLRLITFLISGVIAYTVGGLILVRSNALRSVRSLKACNAFFLIADVLILTAAVHLTGGIDSDLYVLYLLPILLSSYTFTRLGIYATCLLVSISFLLLLSWENAGSIEILFDTSRAGGLATVYLHRLISKLFARSIILVSVSFIWGGFCDYISRIVQQSTNALRLQLRNNERLVAEVEAKAAREGLINSINSALRNTLNLNIILATAVHQLSDAVRCSACAIVCSTDDPSKPHISRAINTSTARDGDKTLRFLSDELCSFLFAKKATYEINDQDGQVTKTFVLTNPHNISGFTAVAKELKDLKIQSLIVQPMIFGDKSEGIIIIGETTNRKWTDSELDLIKSVAGQVAVGIENATLLQQLSEKNEDLIQKNLHLDSKNIELGAVQAQLVHQEKMASLGRLVAGIAHELNNPINFVHGNLPYLRQYFEDLKGIIASMDTASEAEHKRLAQLKDTLRYDFVVTDLDNIIADLNEGTERIRYIIKNLKSFSRLDEADLKEASINEGLESTLKILSQYYGADKISARLNLANLPPVLCYPGQLNQVWMNLLSNAAEAVIRDSQPEVRVSTMLAGDKVLISIEDNGCGIQSGSQTKIFEPFFTTKPVGQGTGLGLSICHSIIDRHGGKIWFESGKQRGTIFKVEIPTQAKLAVSPSKLEEPSVAAHQDGHAQRAV